MVADASRVPRHIYLATALAAPSQRRLAFIMGAVALVLFAALVPFVRLPLIHFPAFIPSYEAALFFIDLITAVLLFEQSARLRSIGLLVLACGYLFDAGMIVPHALSFPGAFTAHGLLGAKAQTTAWLFVFWHGGFPLFVFAYAVLRRFEQGRASQRPPATARLIAGAAVGVLLLVGAFTLLTTWGHDWLPVVIQGSDYSLLVTKGISPAVWAITLGAMLSLWGSKQRAMDLWLMLVMWIWLFDIALSAVIGSTRFDLGFYAGRMFGLVAASFLLIALLVEMARLHAGAVGAAASAEARLAQLERRRGRSETATAPAGGADDFISRQNIAHYRSLLEQTSLDDARRRSVERLLDEEEAKLKPKSSAVERGV